ncbi:hypothetical protein, partial [Medusavirus stheno T3]
VRQALPWVPTAARLHFERWLANTVARDDGDEDDGTVVDLPELHEIYLRQLLSGDAQQHHPVSRHTMAYELRRNHYGTRRTSTWRLKPQPKPEPEPQPDMEDWLQHFSRVRDSVIYLNWLVEVLL